MLPQNHRELYRNTLRLSALCANQNEAAVLTFTILDLWFEPIYPELMTGRGCNKLALNQAVRTFSDELRKLSFVEGAFWLACGYSTWVGKEERKEKAMFFTPPKLAEHVIDTLIEQGASLETHRWFDPACGGAAFIVPLAQRMRQCLIDLNKTPTEILDIIESNIVGIDIDETLQSLSVIYLQTVVRDEVHHAKRKIRPDIRRANTLTCSADTLPKFDVLVCNPPYRKLVATDREKIRGDFLTEVEGQHNLYAVFMSALVKVANDSVLLALLTPTSYMSGSHFSKLRSLLTRHLQVLQLDVLNERDSTFVQVEQETAVLYGRRVSKKVQIETPVAVLTTQGTSKVLGKVLLSEDGAAWYVPRNEREFEAFHSTSASPYRLHDYGYIAKIGPLVWNRDTRKQLFLEEEVKAAKSLVPVIWSSNITANGEFHFGRSSGQKGYFSYVDFDNGKSDGLIRSECVILQRVTSADQNRRLVAAVVPQEFISKYGHFIAENHVITLIPKVPKITPEQMRELLMSEQVDLLFRCSSGTVGVTVFELKQLPLPNPRVYRLEIESGLDVMDAVTAAYEKSIKGMG